MATLHSDALNPQFVGGYRPSANEEFMNHEQLAYFRMKLLAWKDGIVRESRELELVAAGHAPQGFDGAVEITMLGAQNRESRFRILSG